MKHSMPREVPTHMHGLSSRRREWDVIIAGMKADMKKILYLPMHEACTCVSPMRKTVF